VFHPLGLNAAAEHQIRHARFAAIYDGKADYAVAAKTVLAT
jgi:hypothetical protein